MAKCSQVDPDGSLSLTGHSVSSLERTCMLLFALAWIFSGRWIFYHPPQVALVTFSGCKDSIHIKTTTRCHPCFVQVCAFGRLEEKLLVLTSSRGYVFCTPYLLGLPQRNCEVLPTLFSAVQVLKQPECLKPSNTHCERDPEVNPYLEEGECPGDWPIQSGCWTVCAFPRPACHHHPVPPLEAKHLPDEMPSCQESSGTGSLNGCSPFCISFRSK